MRNPARRAERCTSCHVGSESEGRFVTHEMYAAGHPPLPPVEVMAFSRDRADALQVGQRSARLGQTSLGRSRQVVEALPLPGADVESQVARQTAVGAIMNLARPQNSLLIGPARSIPRRKRSISRTSIVMLATTICSRRVGGRLAATSAFPAGRRFALGWRCRPRSSPNTPPTLSTPMRRARCAVWRQLQICDGCI